MTKQRIRHVLPHERPRLAPDPGGRNPHGPGVGRTHVFWSFRLAAQYRFRHGAGRAQPGLGLRPVGCRTHPARGGRARRPLRRDPRDPCGRGGAGIRHRVARHLTAALGDLLGIDGQRGGRQCGRQQWGAGRRGQPLRPARSCRPGRRPDRRGRVGRATRARSGYALGDRAPRLVRRIAGHSRLVSGRAAIGIALSDPRRRPRGRSAHWPQRARQAAHCGKRISGASPQASRSAASMWPSSMSTCRVSSNAAGSPASLAGTWLAIAGAANIAGSIATGLALKRFDGGRLLAGIYAVRAAGILALLLLPVSPLADAGLRNRHGRQLHGNTAAHCPIRCLSGMAPPGSECFSA